MNAINLFMEIILNNSIEEKKKFSFIMNGLAGNFGGKIQKDDLAFRFNNLKAYPIEDISKAGSWLLRNREATFPAVPTIGEIIKAIEICTNPKADGKTIAESQLDIVMKYFNYYGSYCDHVFKNSITNFLIKTRWSFQVIGRMDIESLKWFKKEFVEAYMRYSDDQDINAISFDDALGGSMQIENINKLLNLKRL